MTVLSLLSMVDAVEEEIVEGMEHGHDHDHGHSHGEFDPDAVYDRALTDWAGEWKSLDPYVLDGSLDAYLVGSMDETTTLKDARTAQATKWFSDYAGIAIDGDTITFTGDAGETSGEYGYEGYAILEADNGASVWYQYKLSDGTNTDAPEYIMFNDHGYGTPDDAHDHDADAHDHDHGLAHTHLRYGNGGFDALLAVENWSPFYVEATGTVEDILATLTGHSHSHEGEMDEHVWTSPKNAKVIVESIAQALMALDAANADTYRANADAYIAQLDDLDAAFAEAVASGTRSTLVFGDRFPFRYLADAYGLTYYAAFPGCATETEASAATVAFLIDKVADEGIPYVFTMEFSNGKIADTITESTGAQRLEMHSVHNVSKNDFEAGIGYLDLMWENVDKLKEALQ